MDHFPKDLQTLIQIFRRLPGVGKKTAERFAFQLITWKITDRKHFAELLARLHETVTSCPNCGAIMKKPPCRLCDPNIRNPHSLCIVASVKDVFALEETKSFDGMYHVLGGLLSPIDGIGPEKLNMLHLIARLRNLPLEEVILAFDSTVEGDATALYLKKTLQKDNLKVSRLAFGLPMGSSLEYIDEGTLSRAFFGRQSF